VTTTASSGLWANANGAAATMRAAMMGRFKVSSLGMRPRVPNSRCKRKCGNEALRFPTAPRGISHHRSRPVSGLVGSDVSPSRGLAPTVAGLIRPHALTVAGAAEALAGELPHLFPVSPRREVRAGTPRTSALIVQHKSRGSPLRQHRESTLKMNPYTLT
jgi:hypothetical protein